MDILGLLVFPGVAFLLALAWFYEWLDRRFFARLQNRYGPIHASWHSLLRSLTDFIKLLAKEVVEPRVVNKPILRGVPILILTLPLTALFLIPMSGIKALVHFEGDLIFAIFVVSLLAILAFLGGWSSTSRFNTLGDLRAAMQTPGCKVPLAIVLVGPAIVARSLSISRIVQWQATNGLWTIVLTPIGFGIAVLAIIAELEKVPSDISQVETEITTAWQTEFRGRRLALIRLVHGVELVLAAGLLTDLFLGGPSGPISIIPGIVWFLTKATLIVLLLSKLKALFVRFRTGQMISGLWKYFVALAILQLVILQLLFW